MATGDPPNWIESITSTGNQMWKTYTDGVHSTITPYIPSTTTTTGPPYSTIEQLTNTKWQVAPTKNQLRDYKCRALSHRIKIRIYSIYEYDAEVIVTQNDTLRLLLGLYDEFNEIDTIKKITDFLTDDEYTAYVSLES